MSYPKYPAYKDSGVEWLGEVPEGWDVAPISKQYKIQNGFPFSSKKFSPDGAPQHRLIRIRDVLGNDNPIYTDEPCPSQYIINSGDVLIGMDGDFNIAYWQNGQAKLNQRVCAVRGASMWWERFFYYGINTPLKIINDLTFSTTVKHLASSQILKTRFPFPPEMEMRQITRFLDHETTRIDALIEEQQRLIALLQEKRQAVISHAVTKGLDPTVPMKDSGVEWLGEVPAHWDNRSISSISNKITNGYVGPTRDILIDEPGVRYLQSLHIKENKIKFRVPYYVSEAWSRKHTKSILEEGDVLVVQTGDIGQVAVVPPKFEGSNCHALIIISSIRNIILGKWLSWVLNSTYGFHSLLSIQTGALHPHLNCGNVKYIHIPIPPLTEQHKIIGAIEKETTRIDILISEAQNGVNLLQERRSALISAAVTGKIDVRDWQPPAPSKTHDVEEAEAV